MKRFSILLVGSCLLVLCSCAGLGIRSSAQSEFDSGYASFSQGKYEQAASHFRKAAEIEPTFGKAYLYLGRSYLAMGRFIEAIQPLRTAYELSPDEAKKETFNLILDGLIGGAVGQGPTKGF
ncbi:MAG: tetratricopeptide repeat protein [candidate division WOR-3 bacterium]